MAFDEMNLYEPMRRDTLDRVLLHASTPELLLSEIQNGKIYGTFWQDFSKSGIKLADFSARLDECEVLSPQNVLVSVLDCLAEVEGTQFSGVKYPLHFSRLALLKEWFPDSKVIMLFRNPKATIASKLNDSATRARKQHSFIHCFAIHYFTLLFFSWDFVRSVAVFRRHCDGVYKLNYESLVSDRQAVVEDLCKYCGIRFEQEMLTVSGKESSYDLGERETVSNTSIEKYKQILSRFDQWLIDLLTQRSYRKAQ